MLIKSSKIAVGNNSKINHKILIERGFKCPPITALDMFKLGSRYEVQIDQFRHGIAFNAKAIDKFNGYIKTGYKNSVVIMGISGSFMQQKFKTIELAQFVFNECEIWAKDPEYYDERQ